MEAPISALGQWSRLLVVAWSVVLVVIALLHAYAVLVIVSDQLSHDDYWDGLGAGLVLWAIIFLAPVTISAIVLFFLARSGRRRYTEHDEVRRLRISAILTMAWTVLASWATVASAPYLLAAWLVLLVPAWGVVAAARSASVVSRGA